MQRSVLAACSMALFLVAHGVLTHPPRAEAGMVSHTGRFPISGHTEGCNGLEPIAYSGYLRVVFAQTIDGSGGFHLVFHLFDHMSGTGVLTGTSYRLMEINSSTVNDSANGARENTTVDLSKLIGPGPNNNTRVYSISHFTLDASDQIHAFSTFRIDCNS